MGGTAEEARGAELRGANAAGSGAAAALQYRVLSCYNAIIILKKCSTAAYPICTAGRLPPAPALQSSSRGIIWREKNGRLEPIKAICVLYPSFSCWSPGLASRPPKKLRDAAR